MADDPTTAAGLLRVARDQVALNDARERRAQIRHDNTDTAATDGAPMDDNAAYDAAKHDPVAARILDALHKQDAATYNGQSGNIGGLALDAATDVRELVGKEERRRLATLLEDHRATLTEFVDGPDKMLGLVILLLGLDKP